MALPELLNDSDGEEESSEKLTINKNFAAKYKKFKECQELDRLKQKYGNNEHLSGESSSSGESEDEDAEALTPQIEEDFLHTLSMLKEKNPKIYEKDSVFFKSADTGNGSNEKVNLGHRKCDKAPLLLKDYERRRLLERKEKAYISDSDDDGEEEEVAKKRNDLTYVEEQEQLKESFKQATNSDSDDEGDLLQMREKSIDASAEGECPKSEKYNSAVLNRYWNNDEINNEDKFLRDYILKKKYVLNSDSAHVPSYNEVVGNHDVDEADFEENELDREEEFERKFNFRYEEPDPEFIKRFPRTIAESVRRKDDQRKQQRKVREERKAKEKEKKKEELRRLKNLKRKEIMDKIEKLKEITGNEKVGFLQDDMQDDFDVSKYDKLMEKVFDNEYYDDENLEEEKPVFSDDSENEEYFEEIADGDEDYIPHCEDTDFNMDADYDPRCQFKDDGSKLKKNGRTSKFAEAVLQKKPVFDPQQKSFDEYFDEYYKLDFEDVIDDMPVRFKYREVPANDFGLSTEDILNAEDKELNEWCSLRKTTQYLNEEEEKKVRQKFKKKVRDKNKKQRIFSSLRENTPEDDNNDDPNQTRITKPRSLDKLQKKKAGLRNLNVKSTDLAKRKTLISSRINQKRYSVFSSVNRTKVKNIRRHFKGGSNGFVKKLSLERLAAYGMDERRNKSD